LFSPDTSGSYSFPFYECVLDSGVCCLKSSVNVCVPDCRQYIPNAISPNGDNVNDYWILENFDDTVSITIFNRWGEVVYEDENYQNDWNGVDKKGKDLPEGVYYYHIVVHGLTFRQVYSNEELTNPMHSEEEIKVQSYPKNLIYNENFSTETIYYKWVCERLPYEPMDGTILIER